ncbi:GMC family oxidoreductase N-terminal domain-containing protein [Sphingomonas sp.]|uniref:GMC family oxidoreductase n=1 Tax=Sphingomonas sp. TaxID=28214 RepID=UPI00286A5FC1|nr:GMC family oxidoreductase N-terminal domain-containing protein [Sphingomonas sp.]
MEIFDYVVVGAGTAGCVLASRLSEDGTATVLLLEAGGSDRSIWIQLPIGYGRTYFDKRINWMYDSEPIAGLNGRSSYWPRGKVIGGSGSINAMVYVRGQPRDFDHWKTIGNVGWGWNDVLPYFRKSETYQHGQCATHGGDGPMHVSDISAHAHPLCERFIETAQALGFERNPDLNAPPYDGIGIYPINTHRGRRASSANAFLRPALRRQNLELRTGAHATRILFEGRRAIGVRYRRDGHESEVRANREIILAGGAINSPQLLQLSGVGDPALLMPLGVDVVHSLPAVGENLQDHLAVSYFYKSRLATLNDELRPLLGKLRAGLRYARDRGGPLSMSVNQGGGFVRSHVDEPHVDLQLYFSPVSYTQTPLSARKLLNPDPFSAFLLSFNSCRPTSRGSIRIASTNAFSPPGIQPNYLSTEHDVAGALVGCRLLRMLARTAPLADIITEELIPGRAVGDDAEALMADFRARADTVYHPTSSCAMGPNPHTSVVDARLRVHGISGLRVVDASIFPTITSGNTNAPTVMVAEKGAAMIIEDARSR